MVIALFGGAVLLQLFFQWWMQRGLSAVPNIEPDPHAPITVVIAFKNEADTIPDVIRDLKLQNHQSFSCLLINDHSEDGGESLVKELIKGDERFSLVDNPGEPGKKRTLQVGIDQSTTKAIALTDADCRIHDVEWLSKLAGVLSSHDAAIGVGLSNVTGHWLNRFIAFETVKTAMQYSAAATQGFAYMAVGRSMGITKSAFREAGGFDKHIDLASGSDDLLIQSLKGGASIGVVPGAVTFTQPPSSLSAYLKQRKRHLSAAPRYPFLVKLSLGAYELSNMLLPIGVVIAILNFNWLWGLFLLLTLVKTWLSKSNYQMLCKLTNAPDVIAQLWRYEYVHSWTNSLFSVLAQWTKNEGWKEKR